MSESKKRDWVVRMRCTVIKDVLVRDCTREQAQSDPFEFAEDDVEIVGSGKGD